MENRNRVNETYEARQVEEEEEEKDEEKSSRKHE